MSPKNRITLALVYVVATIQFVWCYLWLTRPYVNTLLYEQGRERMPFQGRTLMMLPMRWAHQSTAMIWLGGPFARSHFWFPKPVAPRGFSSGGDRRPMPFTNWISNNANLSGLLSKTAPDSNGISASPRRMRSNLRDAYRAKFSIYLRSSKPFVFCGRDVPHVLSLARDLFCNIVCDRDDQSRDSVTTSASICVE
jgi:hypothetical protein